MSAEFLQPEQPPVIGQPFKIASDPRATYTLLAVRKRPDGLIEIDTKRIGRDGLPSWTARLVDLAAGKFGYICDHDDEDLFALSPRTVPNPLPSRGMMPFEPGSISDLVAKHAAKLVT